MCNELPDISPLQSSYKIQPLTEEWCSMLEKSWKFSDEKTYHMLTTLSKLKRIYCVFSQDVEHPIAWAVIYRFVMSIREL